MSFTKRLACTAGFPKYRYRMTPSVPMRYYNFESSPYGNPHPLRHLMPRLSHLKVVHHSVMTLI